MRRLLVAALLGAWLCGCASYTAIAPKERESIEHELTSRSNEQFLKLSYFVTPFLTRRRSC
jgi:hypothetical protein